MKIKRKNQIKYANKMYQKFDGNFNDFNDYDKEKSFLFEITIDDLEELNFLLYDINDKENYKMIKWKTKENDHEFANNICQKLNLKIENSQYLTNTKKSYLRID